jgi:peptidoglycan/LPS O-acetylase OafA/YrhL
MTYSRVLESSGELRDNHLARGRDQKSASFFGVLVPNQRIPSLDGLRAVSICLVLLAHLPKVGIFAPLDHRRWVSGLGDLGVRIFFIISGFLITKLLLQEGETTGKVSLPVFYFRRVMRIFPAMYGYLGVLAISVALGWIYVPPRDFIYGATYVMDFVPHPNWNLGHLWSLAVEEQFYMLWPAALVWSGPKRAFKIALGVVLISPVVRIAFLQFAAARPLLDMAFPVVADALATGCLLAGAHAWLGQQQWYVTFLRSARFWILPPAVLVLNALPGTKLNLLVFQTAMNVCIALSMDRWVRFPEDPVGNSLNATPVRALGVLSYSLYLWQEPFLNPRMHTFWQSFPISIIASCVCAYVSYRCLERPGLALRGRIERSLQQRLQAAG